MLEPCPICKGTGEINPFDSHYPSDCYACDGTGRRTPPASQSEALSPLMEVLWPLLGGNHTDAETWQQISDTLEVERAAARREGIEEAGAFVASLNGFVSAHNIAELIRSLAEKQP